MIKLFGHKSLICQGLVWICLLTNSFVPFLLSPSHSHLLLLSIASLLLVPLLSCCLRIPNLVYSYCPEPPSNLVSMLSLCCWSRVLLLASSHMCGIRLILRSVSSTRSRSTVRTAFFLCFLPSGIEVGYRRVSLCFCCTLSSLDFSTSPPQHPTTNRRKKETTVLFPLLQPLPPLTLLPVFEVID